MPTLRPYQPKDYAHFLELDLETALDALVDATPEEQSALRERWPKLLLERHAFSKETFSAPSAQLFTLDDDDGAYLGHLWLTEKIDAVTGTRFLEVTTMGIVRGGRGRGLGRVLMQKAEHEAQARGLEVIELSVAGNNRRARDLYRDLGYDTTRRTMRKRMRAP